MSFKCSAGKKPQAKLTKPTVGAGSRCQTTKTPRRTVFGLTQVEKPSLQNDFEINRDIFTPSPQKRRQVVKEEKKVKTESVRIPEIELEELRSLIKRIPSPEETTEEDTFAVTPVLDRILGTIGPWSDDVIEALKNDKTIIDLQNKLFELIEVNDFLIRTVTCRILLCFSTANPDLLSPITRIFYKLSCDKSNFDFFVDESLENVLLSLLQSQSQEPSVYAAGTIKNVTKNSKFQKNLCAAGFFQIIKPFFEMDDADPQVISLLLHAIKHMCANDTFRKEITETDFVLKLAKRDGLFETALSLASLLPELDCQDRIKLLKMIKEKGYKEYRLFIEGTVSGAETNDVIGDIILMMTKEAFKQPEAVVNTEESQQLLQALCSIASKAVENPKLCEKYENDGVFVRILKCVDFDTATLLLALDVVRQFKKDENKSIAREYDEMFGQNC